MPANATGPHPSLDDLTAFDHGLLSPGRWEEVERHVAGCDACCGRLEALPEDTLAVLLRSSFASPLSMDTCPVDAPPADTPSAPGVSPAPAVPAELADHPRYRILGLLGIGGMGAVYQAEHRLMERVVALKVIRRSLTDNPAAVERFRLEVKAAARLDHPNIVRACDADCAGDLHFLVMEHIEGISLDRLVTQRGPLPVAEACEYVRQAALGLQHAHERGMVHRDIKPANLMVARQSRDREGPEAAPVPHDRGCESAVVKILDFGLARFAHESGSGEGLTPFGAVVGTPDYVAPEQAMQPRQADVRADIYSLGCTLYHLLAGRPPFAEGSALHKLMAHQQRPPQPLSELRPDVPPALLQVLDRLLAKDPAQRYQMPAEVATALAPFTQPDERTAELLLRRARPSRRGLIAMAAAAALLLVGLGGAAAWFLTRDRQRTVDEPRGELPDEPRVGLAPGELRRVGGGTGPFTAVAISRECDLGLAAGPDYAVQLWDLHAGKLLARMEGHTDTVTSLSFANDKKLAVSGSLDRTVRVWDVVNRTLLHTLDRRHTDAVTAVDFTHNNRHAFSVGRDGRIILWNAKDGRYRGSMRGTPYAMESLSVVSYGRYAVTGCSDDRARVWDVDPSKDNDRDKGWRPLRSLIGHQGPIRCVAWSFDGRYLLTGGSDGTVRLWRGSTDRQLASIDAHPGGVTCAALWHDHNRALTGGADGSVKLWDLNDGRELARFAGHEGGVLGVRLCPEGKKADGRRAVTGGRDGTFRLWEVPEYQPPARPADYFERFHAVALSPDGRVMALAVADERLKLRDVVPTPKFYAFKERPPLPGHDGLILGLAFAGDNRTLLSGGHDRLARVWDVAEGKERTQLRGHAASVRAVAITDDGKVAATGSADQTVRLWETDTGKQVAVLKGHNAKVRSVALAGDLAALVSSDADGAVIVWDVANLRPCFTLRGHQGAVHGVALTADGKTLATAGADGKVKVWGMETGKERLTIKVHNGAATSVALTRDGSLLVSGGAEGAVYFWDPATGQARGEVPGHRGVVSALSFRADGKVLASACADGEVMLADVDRHTRRKP